MAEDSISHLIPSIPLRENIILTRLNFDDYTHNTLQAGLVSLSLYMIGGFVYTSDSLQDFEKGITTSVVLISTYTFIGCSLCTCFVNANYNRHNWRIERLVHNWTVGVWIKTTAYLNLNVPTSEQFLALIGDEGQPVSISTLAGSTYSCAQALCPHIHAPHVIRQI